MPRQASILTIFFAVLTRAEIPGIPNARYWVQTDLEPFARDAMYMRALFDYGYQLGRKGYSWHKTPPGLTVAKSR